MSEDDSLGIVIHGYIYSRIQLIMSLWNYQLQLSWVVRVEMKIDNMREFLPIAAYHGFKLCSEGLYNYWWLPDSTMQVVIDRNGNIKFSEIIQMSDNVFINIGDNFSLNDKLFFLKDIAFMINYDDEKCKKHT